MPAYRSYAEALSDSGLEVPAITALVADGTLYTVMAIQPRGHIAVSEDHVGPSDSERATRQFVAYFEIAAQRGAELVLAPEYACPWTAVRQSLQAGVFPAPGALWALGCEAITPAAIRAMHEALPDLTWIYDCPPPRGARFLNPLLYLFCAQDRQGAWNKVALIQFKTHPMADGDWERDRLIPGTTVYWLHAPSDHIRLISLVCSDALAFEAVREGRCGIDEKPYLIFHPQLIKEPRDTAISEYRKWLYTRAASEKLEVISLNWARGFRLPQSPEAGNPYGGSTLYTKAPDFDVRDERLRANHELGMYYSRWQAQRAELGVLSFDEHVFYFRQPKVAVRDGAVIENRTGPEMISTFAWEEDTPQWSECRANDGFSELCCAYDEPDCDFLDVPEISPIDRERFFMLTSGNLDPATDWHSPRKLRSLRAEDNERTQRMTFTHETDPLTTEFRQSVMARYIRLRKDILSAGESLPDVLMDRRDRWRLIAPERAGEFRFNLSDGEGARATAIYLDVVPPARAKALYDKIVGSWGLTETRRLAVWYTHNNAQHHLSPPPPTVFEEEVDPTSINRDEP